MEKDAQRVDVGTPIHRLPSRLLGRHIARRTHHDAVPRSLFGGKVAIRIERGGLGCLRQSKVEDLYLAVFHDHDVARLEVAMNDSSLVRSSYRRCELLDDLEEAR